ncbi:MAG: hypothetical protein WHS87_12080 [Anaerolineales bacterium]
MSEEKEISRTKEERLPIEKRAELLSGETSLYFNVAKFEHAQRIASLFSSSTMVPDHFQGNIANCLIALNYADRLKADPFMVMQNMYIVHGRPGVEAKLVIALINQSGKYSEPLKFRFEGSGDDYGCTAWTREAKSGEVVEGPKVTWKMVKSEGWDKDKINKKTGYTQTSKWKTMPEMMFRYRAASYFANVHCPELKLGMQTVEEINDYVELRQAENGKWQPPTAATAGERPVLDPEGFAEILEDNLLERFLEVTAEKNHSSREDVVRAANANQDEFIAAFKAWKQKGIAPAPPAEKAKGRKAKKQEPPPQPDPDLESRQEAETKPDPAPAPNGQGSLFPQSERDKLIAEIKRYPAEAITKARTSMGLAENVWPPTAEGCGRMLDLLLEG